MLAAPCNIGPAPIPKRVARSGSVPSIISADSVTGTLNSTGDMQIDGTLEGDVRSVGLVIGEQARRCMAKSRRKMSPCAARWSARIHARKVLLCATSHVEGDILHEAFAVEAGAFFEGNCRHSEIRWAIRLRTPKKAVPKRPARASSASDLALALTIAAPD